MKINILKNPVLKGNFQTLFFLILTLSTFRSFADGTKQVSPTSAQITSLVISSTSGSNWNAPQERRIYFTITDHTVQNLYFGANTFMDQSANNYTTYYRIKDATGTVIGSPAVLSSTISYTQAFNGPNIGGTNPSGYTPKTFDPSANGDYYIEIYTSATAGASSNLTTTNIWSTFWDFTVGEASGVTHPGRVFSQNWNFRATAPTDSPAYSGGFDTKISPAFYSYTNDQTVVKVQFTDFQPLGFNPAFNSYGVNPSETNWLVGRKSFSQGTTIPALTNSFKTFLSSPDPGVFPVAALAAAPTLSGNVQGCAPNYNIPYNTSVLGDVRFLLDLNGVAGYQANSMDRVLEALNVPAGSNLMPWDGKDGLGNVLPPNTNVITTISVLRGRVNIPLYDAELNQQGFTVSSISPQSSTAIKLFWDDASTTTI
ncbi:hypothetical protein, partial [Lacihabitans sp. LS3-19]|uniref:hypothetical protein n=1 Tax=Lacihabitans sp. LS3-19 TaxID=2487335 RepID=UPI0020CE681B